MPKTAMLLRVSKPYPTDVPKDGGFRIRNDGNSGVHEPGSSDQELRHESNVPRQNEGLHGSLGYRQSRDSSNRVNLASKVAMMDEDDHYNLGVEILSFNRCVPSDSGKNSLYSYP